MKQRKDRAREQRIENEILVDAYDEEELPRSRLRELPTGDQPTLVERSCERECRRAAQQRSVEVEERRRLCHVRRPAAASASSRRG